MRAHALLLLPLATASPVFAVTPHVTTEYGIDFVTVGDPGNRNTRSEETPFHSGDPYGSVGYEYRMARTELTVGQWYEFVDAYYTANPDIPSVNPPLLGPDLNIVLGQLEVRPGRSLDRPTQMGWEFAARYANWLHNDKVNEAWAFESGAYDTSTFTENPDGTPNHQAERSPGARFWIPSQDEWVKAAYWDPTRDGGEGGYWLYPNQSDEWPAAGLPSEGGLRNAGFSDDGFPLDVGSYPSVQSPWGLLDVAGGVSEYTEAFRAEGFEDRRIRRGTNWTDTAPEDEILNLDRIDWDMTSGTLFTSAGLRIVAAVPAPPALLLFAMPLLVCRRL